MHLHFPNFILPWPLNNSQGPSREWSHKKASKSGACCTSFVLSLSLQIILSMKTKHNAQSWFDVFQFPEIFFITCSSLHSWAITIRILYNHPYHINQTIQNFVTFPIKVLPLPSSQILSRAACSSLVLTRWGENVHQSKRSPSWSI